MDWLFSDQVSSNERGWALTTIPKMAGANIQNYYNDIFLPRFLKIHAEFKETQFIFPKIIKANLGQLACENSLQSFLKIITDNGIKEAHMAVAQSVDTVQTVL